MAEFRGAQPNAKEVWKDEGRRPLPCLRNTAEAISRLPVHVDLEFFRKVSRDSVSCHLCLTHTRVLGRSTVGIGHNH